MNFKQLLVKNTALQLCAHGIALISGLAMNGILSRKLGVTGFGQFNYIFAFYYFFLSLNDFGTNTIVVREIAQDRSRAEEIFGTMLLFKIFVAIVCMIFASVAIFTMQFPAELRSSLLLFSWILPITALQLPSLIFQVLLKAEYPAAITSVSKLFTLIAVAIGAHQGASLFQIVFLFLCGEALILAGVFLFSRKFTGVRFRFNAPLCKSILRSSIPLGFAVLFVAVINRIDFLLLERIAGLQQVGLYSAAYKITNLFEAFPLIVMSTIYPVMSQYAKADRDALKSLYEKSILYLGSFGLISGMIIFIAAPWMLSLIFGEAFRQSAAALRILVWSSVCLYFALSGGNLLICLGREKVNLFLNAAGATLNVGLNLFLIPRFGYVGAAIATTATFGFILIGITIASYRFLYTRERIRTTALLSESMELR